MTKPNCIGCPHADLKYDLCNHPAADLIELNDEALPDACPAKEEGTT